MWQLWPRPTKWMWRYYLPRAAAPPFCVVWCPRLSRNWYEWSRGFMNPLSTSIPRCKAVSNGTTQHSPAFGVCILVTRLSVCFSTAAAASAADVAPAGAAASALVSCILVPVAAYQANKVHCLFAVFASHVCLLNCHRFPYSHVYVRLSQCVRVCMCSCVSVPCALMHN